MNSNPMIIDLNNLLVKEQREMIKEKFGYSRNHIPNGFTKYELCIVDQKSTGETMLALKNSINKIVAIFPNFEYSSHNVAVILSVFETGEKCPLCASPTQLNDPDEICELCTGKYSKSSMMDFSEDELQELL